MAKRLLSHAAVALFWLLHFLPLPLLATLGRALGRLLLALGKRRRHIAATNLALCFPELDAAAREQRLRAHFEAVGRSLLERSLLWWSRPIATQTASARSKDVAGEYLVSHVTQLQHLPVDDDHVRAALELVDVAVQGIADGGRERGFA